MTDFMDDFELSTLDDVLSATKVDGVTFQVIAKVVAVRDEGGATIDNLVGPLVIVRTRDLYEAMLSMSLSMEGVDNTPDVLMLQDKAEAVAQELRNGKYKFKKRKGG